MASISEVCFFNHSVSFAKHTLALASRWNYDQHTTCNHEPKQRRNGLW